jgi:hypothetical protein
MFNPRAAATLVLTMVATGCGNAPAAPFVGPPATSTPSPAATAMPTPTPTATPVGATPTPTPTAVATATPAATVPNPSSLTFTATGATSAQQLSVAQAGFAGTFAQTNTCAAVASVIPANVPAASPVFTVTPNAGGSCSITIAGGSGQTVIVSVAVTTSGLVVSGRGVRP